jgi:hypothetical protein
MKRAKGGNRSQSRSILKCSPIPGYKALAGYIKSPHKVTFQPYSSAGCDMYIDIKNDPHIHIHGYSDHGNHGVYSYSISGNDIRNRKANLTSKFDYGYESVLAEMYDALENTEHEKPAYQSPTRSIRYSESSRPTKSRIASKYPVADVMRGTPLNMNLLGEFTSRAPNA